MQRERAAEILTQMHGKTVLVVGDVILDSFVYGSVQRISREAPAPILSETRRTDMLGGAGNLARNIESLGGQAHLISAIGADGEGARIKALAEQSCGDRAAFIEQGQRQTPSKIRYVSKAQQMFCVDRDPSGQLGQDDAKALLDEVKHRLNVCDLVVLSDYGRGILTPYVSRAVIDLARAAGKPVTVDPRGHDYTRYDGATLIKPNADELAAETGLAVTDDTSAENALKALSKIVPQTTALIVTRGAGGMSLRTATGTFSHHSSRPREVFDVSGAGDTALAALSLSLAAGVDLSECMAIADLAAGVAVTKPGTAIVEPYEILDDAGIGEQAPDWRVMSREDAATLCAHWREQGLKVGFTNGCFDILHPGHLSVLRYAASACDRLIVGLNSDASVSRLKGEDRPINSQQSRAVMLASLEMTDRIVVFEDDTPEELIQALKPDVMIKGADYQVDDLPGAAFIKANGGEVLLAPLLDGLSTTRIVEKMKT